MSFPRPIPLAASPVLSSSTVHRKLESVYPQGGQASAPLPQGPCPRTHPHHPSRDTHASTGGDWAPPPARALPRASPGPSRQAPSPAPPPPPAAEAPDGGSLRSACSPQTPPGSSRRSLPPSQLLRQDRGRFARRAGSSAGSDCGAGAAAERPAGAALAGKEPRSPQVIKGTTLGIIYQPLSSLLFQNNTTVSYMCIFARTAKSLAKVEQAKSSPGLLGLQSPGYQCLSAPLCSREGSQSWERIKLTWSRELNCEKEARDHPAKWCCSPCGRVNWQAVKDLKSLASAAALKGKSAPLSGLAHKRGSRDSLGNSISSSSTR
ncbi:uncharacterized protein LOC141583843 [Saimiri boliviensis]|uniref:uncharacterized protein LOC141583843 n=1 Tax=Saimiri boliviensis TaxID=27679 RepID=UPI003D76D2EC